MGRIEPKHLDGVVALAAAESTQMCKRKGERDTEFVKRIVCAYLNAAEELGVHKAPGLTYDDVMALASDHKR